VAFVVAATVLTAGTADLAIAAMAGAAEEGGFAAAFGTFEVVSHGAMVFAPGLTLGGIGLTSMAYGLRPHHHRHRRR
jgi:hypothetical protein